MKGSQRALVLLALVGILAVFGAQGTDLENSDTSFSYTVASPSADHEVDLAEHSTDDTGVETKDNQGLGLVEGDDDDDAAAADAGSSLANGEDELVAGKDGDADAQGRLWRRRFKFRFSLRRRRRSGRRRRRVVARRRRRVRRRRRWGKRRRRSRRRRRKRRRRWGKRRRRRRRKRRRRWGKKRRRRRRKRRRRRRRLYGRRRRKRRRRRRRRLYGRRRRKRRRRRRRTAPRRSGGVRRPRARFARALNARSIQRKVLHPSEDPDAVPPRNSPEYVDFVVKEKKKEQEEEEEEEEEQKQEKEVPKYFTVGGVRVNPEVYNRVQRIVRRRGAKAYGDYLRMYAKTKLRPSKWDRQKVKARIKMQMDWLIRNFFENYKSAVRLDRRDLNRHSSRKIMKEEVDRIGNAEFKKFVKLWKAKYEPKGDPTKASKDHLDPEPGHSGSEPISRYDRPNAPSALKETIRSDPNVHHTIVDSKDRARDWAGRYVKKTDRNVDNAPGAYGDPNDAQLGAIP